MACTSYFHTASVDSPLWDRFVNAEACALETPLASFIVRHRVRMMQVSVITTAVLLIARHYRPSNLTVYDQASIAGISLIVVGLVIRSWAAAILNKQSVLATSGPYSMFRHPLYVGSTFMLVGFCVLIGDIWTAAVLLSTWIITYPATVAREESRLAQLFPAEWTRYVKTTPRLFPPHWPTGLGSVSAKTWLHNREYQAVLACVLGIVAVEAWRRLA